MYPIKYTKEALEQAVRKNISILGTMRTLGAPLTSGSLRAYLRSRFKYYEIDTSHFLGMGWNKGIGSDHKGGFPKRVIKPEDKRGCSKCGKTKFAKEFYKRKKGLRTGEYYKKCKKCMKERGIEYYHSHIQRQRRLAILRKRRYNQERLSYVNSLKKDKRCFDCGKIYPTWVMDFDHLEGSKKLMSVSLMVRHNWSYEKILEETKKCDIVCSNCHRNRTYIRMHSEAAVAKVVKAEV